MLLDPRTAGTVVVGCDRSWESQNAVSVATHEASRRDVDLVLFAVVEPRMSWPGRLSLVARAEAEARRDAQSAVDRAKARIDAKACGVTVRTVVADDLDSPELDDVARGAGLLVLGRRGGRGQVAFALGSTSAELARRFTCPLLVIHDQGQPMPSKRTGPNSAVVAGMDSIGGAGAVLSVAAAEAAVRNLPLVVVHAVQAGEDVDLDEVSDDWRMFRAALGDLLHPTGVPYRLIVTGDDPVKALLNRVEPGDLIVVGTRGQGRLAGLIGGSVSRRVLDCLPCDVMVVQLDVLAAGPALQDRQSHHPASGSCPLTNPLPPPPGSGQTRIA